ncbi:MAG: hypothetical protein HDT26_07610 [Subdoligranulum sp.]|nr:hypothetical protein [Subdoligranulum sp.]
MQTNTAYDFSLFEGRDERPKLRVEKRTRRQKIKAGLGWARVVTFAAIFLALVVSVLYSQVQSTELSAQLRREQDRLEDLQSEYTYLTNEMEMRTNLSAVQEYAANVLKMIKMDRSQITYVTAAQENSVERFDGGLRRLADGLTHTIASFVEYLEP